MKDEYSIENLRQIVKSHISGKRYDHTLGVEREIERLGEIFLPDRITELRAAALLHDITKTLNLDEHLKIYEKYNATPSESCLRAHKLLHSQTAALIVENEYPRYALPDIMSSILNHTSGKAGMSVFDMLLFLADYIEDGRSFSDCVVLREFFWNDIADKKSEEERLSHLYATMAYGLDMTIENLIDEGKFIAPETVDARNWFISLIG